MTDPAAGSTPAPKPGAALLLGALGVVFGDIGTSPIYTLRETLAATHGLHAAPPAQADVLGVLSLLFWAVMLIVTVKYVLGVMRADNEGEGGIMALMALALPVAGRARTVLLWAGLAGTALFFGDAMITPAISVLSAIEGAAIAVPTVHHAVVPIAAGVLVALFALQSAGTRRVGALFGPVMAAWFVVLAASGALHLARHPVVLRALDPRLGVGFLAHAPAAALLGVLGSVFLAVTGGEALYADMGQFGRPPIRLNWFAIVLPALVLNYFGQGALVLADPAAAGNPFFHLFGGWTLFPAVLLATLATIIASQAVISGGFALVQQAIHLGALPRLEMRQTSDESAGQVYVPVVNWILAATVLGLVIGFRSSSHLASAYGIAVSGNMLATTLLVACVAIGRWGWQPALAIAVAVPFALIDLVFIVANGHKLADGGWFPLTVGALLLTLMLVWRRGRQASLAALGGQSMPIERFIDGLEGADAPGRTRGTAVYLTGNCDHAPASLILNTRHNAVVHETVVLLKAIPSRAPRIDEAARVGVTELRAGFRTVEVQFGFAERPDVPGALARHRDAIGCDLAAATFFIGRENPVHARDAGLPRWQEHLYALLTRNAVSATDYFAIPDQQVVELGSRVAI